MPNYDVLQDTNSYHGIKTTYGMPGMPKPECDTCKDSFACGKLAPWIKLCESEQSLTDQNASGVVVKKQQDG